MKMPSTVEYNLLCALGAREISGRDLAKRYEREQNTSISYGTLYTAMRRLKEGGWVDVRESDEGDRRVRYFKLSSSGAQHLPDLIKLQSTFDFGGATT
ncbi:MAG: PadR family transcriptional regulator [Prosthecobacter sp.]|nr:PadR family transcriptional regulator [Prosthecobacter sp.]